MGARFKANGKTYNIPEDQADAFVGDMQSQGIEVSSADAAPEPAAAPELTSKLRAGGKTYNIPDGKRDEFIADMKSQGQDVELEGSDPRGVVNLPEVQVQGEADPWWLRGLKGSGLVRAPENADEAAGMPSLAAAKNFNGKMDMMANRPWEAAGRTVADMAAPLAMGPTSGLAGGLAQGAVQGGLSRYAETGDAAEAANGAGIGAGAGLAGGLAQFASKYARPAGEAISNGADAIANSSLAKGLGKWGGSALGGAAGISAGNAAGPGFGYAGAGLGAKIGGDVGQRALPAAIGYAGDAAQAIGNGVSAVAGNPTAMTFASQQAGNAAARSGALDKLFADQSPQARMSGAVNDGRGNLLGESALNLLQNDPGKLGKWQGEFAKAAASPETGAVTALVNRLYEKDSDFRAGPLVEMQRLTSQGL